MPAGEVSHRPPGRLEGPCSPRHEALLAGAWKDLASLHRAALIRDHRRPRTAAAWRPRALARRAALRWYGSTRCAATRPAAAGPRSGCAGLFLAAAGRRRARRRSQQMRGEPRHVVVGAGGLRSASSRARSTSRELQLAEGATFVHLCTKWEIYLFDRALLPRNKTNPPQPSSVSSPRVYSWAPNPNKKRVPPWSESRSVS